MFYKNHYPNEDRGLFAHGHFYEEYDDSYDEEPLDKEEIKERQQRRARREDKISELRHMREHMCGIGTNRVKRRLSAKAKRGDLLASALLLALKAEDANIQAKINYKYRGCKYSDYAYGEKEWHITELLAVCKTAGYKYGCQSCFMEDTYSIQCIVYCDLPGCCQLSWHSERNPDNLPHYDGEWDQADETTLAKIEEAVLKNKVIAIDGVK